MHPPPAGGLSCPGIGLACGWGVHGYSCWLEHPVPGQGCFPEVLAAPRPSLTTGGATGRAGQGLAMQSLLCVSRRQKRFWLETRVEMPTPQVAEQALHSVPHGWHRYGTAGDAAAGAGWRQRMEKESLEPSTTLRAQDGCCDVILHGAETCSEVPPVGALQALTTTSSSYLPWHPGAALQPRRPTRGSTCPECPRAAGGGSPGWAGARPPGRAGRR